MPRPVGGKGKKNETTHVRVPRAIKEDVVRLVDRYYDDGQYGISQSVPTVDEAILEAKRILKQKRSARISLSKLLTSLYQSDVEL